MNVCHQLSVAECRNLHLIHPHNLHPNLHYNSHICNKPFRSKDLPEVFKSEVLEVAKLINSSFEPSVLHSNAITAPHSWSD